MNYKDKCWRLAELYKEASITGQPFEYNYEKHGWSKHPCLPDYDSALEKWRVAPITGWRNRLFEGAPVIFSNNSIGIWYNHNTFDKSVSYRLPDIKKSPRNVWLCPHNEKPEGFDDVKIMLRDYLNNMWDYEPGLDDYNPDKITAFMILGDL